MLVNQFLLLGAVLFCIGVYGALARKIAVLVLMSIELILNSVNINLIAFSMMNSANVEPAGSPPLRSAKARMLRLTELRMSSIDISTSTPLRRASTP